MIELYGETNPRDIPTYSISEAVHYLRIPAGTIRSWTVGRYYPVADGLKFFQPLIPIPDLKPRLLSFVNLVEIQVLRAFRKYHQIKLDKVRIALDFIEEHLQVSHPLANERFHTDGIDFFIEQYGSSVNVSKSGQMEIKDLVNAHLKRTELDETGLTIKFYPFTRSHEEGNPRIVVMDPRIAFGRLVIDGTGIATRVLAERYQAGDSIDELAYDYDCERLQIEEAIRCEPQPRFVA